MRFLPAAGAGSPSAASGVAPSWVTWPVLGITALAAVVMWAAPGTTGPLLVAAGLGGGAAIICFAQAAPLPDRRAWTVLGVAQLMNGVGNIAIAAHPSAWFAHGENLSAVVFTLATTVTGVGMAMLVLPARADWLSAAADGALVIASVFVLAWSSGASGVLARQDATLPQLTGLLSVELDLLILLVGTLLWRSRPPGSRWPVRAAVLAQLSATLSDLAVLGRPVTHVSVGVGWLVSSGLFAAGASRLRRQSDGPVRRLDRDRSLALVTAVVAVCFVAAVAGARQGLDGVSTAGCVVVVLTLLFRQAHAVRRARALALELTLRERRLRLIVSEMRDAVVQLDLAGRITFASPALRQVMGDEQHDSVGRSILDLVHPDDVQLVRVAVADVGRGRAPDRRLQLRTRPAGDRLVHIEALMTAVGSGLLLTVRDVSERVRLEHQLHAAAYQDRLTGLPNRASFDLELARRFDRAPSAPVGVVFLDLDGFKRINDTSGHPAGDIVLVEAAHRIRGAVDGRGRVFRFGGDEFTVLLQADCTMDDGEQVAAAAIAALRRPLSIGSTGVDLSATAGVAVGGAADPAELVRNADLAMYSVKGVRRGAVGRFEPRMSEDFARQVELERRFATAHESGELSLAYQPIVDLRTGRVVAAEALLRWSDRDGTAVDAEEFVPLAEGFGSIVTIGAWALREATRSAVRWAEAGGPIEVSVNVSARQLQDDDLFAVVVRALRESGLPPYRLCLEITESVLLADDEVGPEVLARLRGLGVRVAIDDFGTGYAGLSYLRRLPVDQIKIDRSFLGDGDGEGGGDAEIGGDDALLAGVVGLGRDLGLTVTVEGVETPEQVATLRRLRADRGQGYLFARAQTEEAMTQWASARFSHRDGSPYVEMGAGGG